MKDQEQPEIGQGDFPLTGGVEYRTDTIKTTDMMLIAFFVYQKVPPLRYEDDWKRKAAVFPKTPEVRAALELWVSPNPNVSASRFGSCYRRTSAKIRDMQIPDNREKLEEGVRPSTGRLAGDEIQ